MTPKPASRRIDWTLSATPTRRGVRVFVIFFIIPIGLVCGCFLAFLVSAIIESGPRTPERSFTAMDFFPPTAFHHAGYETIQPRTWLGIDSLRMSDGDDAYAIYEPALDTVGVVTVFVYYQSHWNDALDAYQNQLQYMTSYQPISLLTFQSDRAQEQTLLCTDKVYGPRNMLECDYIARYDEFVINVSTVVKQDQPSMAEFEYILRTIDQRAIELLGPTPVPTP